MEYNSDIIVIGAGAAGMVAAITAARSGAKVMILEHMDMAGKKLLATGNGKCNFTNSRQGVGYYYGDDPAFVLPVFAQFDFRETLAFFEELGIMPKEKNGYYYPASGQASAIREVLLMELNRLNVRIIYNCGIRSVYKERQGFRFDTKTGEYCSKLCLLATGGYASKKTGSDGSGFLYLKQFSHHIIDTVPGLTGLIGKQPFFRELAGIRADVRIGLYIENKWKIAEEGELQLTDYGISGIPVFQVSRFASKALAKGEAVHALLNFSPSMKKEDFEKYLVKRFSQKEKTAAQALIGTFQSKLIPVFLRLSKIDENQMAYKVGQSRLKRLADIIQNFRVDIIGTKKFDHAQVTAGGIDTSEIVNETLESKLVHGLFFAGEMIDIDGKCGGYNLQWAWSSGYVAGLHAAKSGKEIV